MHQILGFPGGLVVKTQPDNAGDAGDVGFIPGWYNLLVKIKYSVFLNSLSFLLSITTKLSFELDYLNFFFC